MCKALSTARSRRRCARSISDPNVLAALLCPPGSAASKQNNPQSAARPRPVGRLGVIRQWRRQWSRRPPRPRRRRWLMTRGCEGPADRVPRAQRCRHRLRGRQLPRAHRPVARARSHHQGHPAHLRWPVHRQRGHLPRRQGRQGLRDGRHARRASSSRLALKDGTKIPLDSKMYVHNLSAVGEQYLDFEPPDNDPPYAKTGDIIKGDEDSLPTSEELLLTQMDSLVGSLDGAELSTVVGEAGHDVPRTRPTRCSGWSTPAPSSSTRRRRTPTPPSALLDTGRTVLQTQADHEKDIRSLRPRPGRPHRDAAHLRQEPPHDPPGRRDRQSARSTPC